MSRTYAAVANPLRRAILARLRDGPARVTDLARLFPVSLAAVSKHIRTLERAGLVCRRVRWREHLLTLEPAHMPEAAGWLEGFREFWESRLDSLEAHLLRKRRRAPGNRRGGRGR